MNIVDLLPTDKLVEFCRTHHITRLAVFGSAVRGDFAPDSDVDLLVEFEPTHTPGLEFFSLQDNLSKLIGRQVDLNTPECLSKYYREKVLSDAKLVYDSISHTLGGRS